jgi:translocation and assembly module TamB
MWSGLVLLAIVLLVVIAIQFILHSDTAHRYILGKAQQKATEALGSNVKVGNYHLTFSGISPTLDLYNVVVAGAAPYPDPPLLTIEHARVGVRVVSVFQKKWYLSEAVVNHPVVHVFVDKAGKDNLPQTKTNGEKQSQTNLFDLGVRHAVLDRGEIYYNNRKSVLDADLHNLDFGAKFDAANPRYYGTLAYTDGHLKMENFNSIPHSLSAEFEYAPDRFVLKNANLKSGASHLTVNATLKNFDQPDLQAEYSAQLDAGEFRTILRNPTLPVGLIDLKGGLNYAAKPNVPMLQAVRLNGSLASRQLQLRTPSFATSVRNLSANYAIRDGDLSVRDLNASVLGGSVKGQMTMTDLAGSSRSRLSATARGVSLAEAKTLIDSPAILKIGITGILNAEAT